MDSQALHLCHVQTLEVLINRSHTILHSLALALMIYYRASFLFQNPETKSAPTCIWILIFASELLLCFIWLMHQAYRWRPVSRTVFIERLPPDDQLPAIDVFICTADPEKEPTVEVMNTVLSAMALDYPPEKLHVYLSDDSGSPATLNGMREACRFAEWWIPFCRKYRITQRCPEAYFFAAEGDDFNSRTNDEFMSEKELIKEKYEEFKDNTMRGHGRQLRENFKISARDHPALIEIIRSNEKQDESKMPALIVYVSREKKPSQPHHFKAGAINALLRISGVMSNSPYILMLDCDMYCRDPTSARQAMCFNLDPYLSSSLAFVQFPQKFHNISHNDIYDSRMRSIFTVLWSGLDGLKGPILSGTCFYVKRFSLYGTSPSSQDTDLLKHRDNFGASNEFIKSLGSNWESKEINGDMVDLLLKEVKLLGSCTYENGSQWGQKVGFIYGSVAEDLFTGFIMHCKGWRSVYCNLEMPQFLGNGVTNLNDMLIQRTRWSCGLMDVTFSNYFPLVYGSLRMSFLQTMCYTAMTSSPLYCLSLWCFATIPQLCLLIGIPIYPQVSSSFFIVFCFIFFSALLKHLQEVLMTGGSIRICLNEQRLWMIKSITSHLYGTLDALFKKMGLRKASFMPTNKAVDSEQSKRYQMGIIDFQASTMFLAPMAGLVALNLVSFLVGIGRAVKMGSWNEILLQNFLCFYVLVVSWPIMEAMVIRSDKAGIPLRITLISVIFTFILATLILYV